jgi:hypothetical protein
VKDNKQLTIDEVLDKILSITEDMNMDIEIPASTDDDYSNQISRRLYKGSEIIKNKDSENYDIFKDFTFNLKVKGPNTDVHLVFDIYPIQNKKDTVQNKEKGVVSETCNNDIESIGQQNTDLTLNDLIKLDGDDRQSDYLWPNNRIIFMINGKRECINKNNLIDYWNNSGSSLYGNCILQKDYFIDDVDTGKRENIISGNNVSINDDKTLTIKWTNGKTYTSDKDGIVSINDVQKQFIEWEHNENENLCEIYFKIPTSIGFYFITQKEKERVLYNNLMDKYNILKLTQVGTVYIGQNQHQVGEYINEHEPVYEITPA